MEYQPDHLKITAWAEEDRPREKLMTKGKAVLTDAELIAILMGSGTRELTAVDLAKLILKSVDGNLHDLAGCRLLPGTQCRDALLDRRMAGKQLAHAATGDAKCLDRLRQSVLAMTL